MKKQKVKVKAKKDPLAYKYSEILPTPHPKKSSSESGYWLQQPSPLKIVDSYTTPGTVYERDTRK